MIKNAAVTLLYKQPRPKESLSIAGVLISVIAQDSRIRTFDFCIFNFEFVI